MKKGVAAGGIAAAAVVLYLVAAKPAGFSAQYITLPSGAEAYCNRQGYREVRTQFSGNVLVTAPDGSFVGCDARVGPEWDHDRTGWNGALLTSAEMDAARNERERPDREREAQKAAADADRGRRQMFAVQHNLAKCAGYSCDMDDGLLYSPAFNATYANATDVER